MSKQQCQAGSWIYKPGFRGKTRAGDVNLGAINIYIGFEAMRLVEITRHAC